MATSLFIFHRDLRLYDNVGLDACLKASKVAHLVFIFTPQQVKHNDYFSEHSFSFMLGALKDLSDTVKISFFYEDNKKCVERLIDELDITDLWENRDFSPFARAREKKNSAVCKKRGVVHHLSDDVTLLPMGTLLTEKHTCYLKYTPFLTNAKKIRVPEARIIGSAHLQKVSKKSIKGEIKLSEFNFVPSLVNRRESLKLLKKFSDLADTYTKRRNFPAIDATSHLGPHLHFGTVSPREVYWAIKTRGFREQLYWREFYMYIVNYVSVDYSKKSFTLPKMNKIEWKTDRVALKKWQKGETGVPIVDAGMRELLGTGYMHNRLRMITAMYLIFYLRIHWKEGEKWFAQNLRDYSYANNYGGWVWCAGIEVHSNPYFRVFSMEEQNKRFDKDCIYVKRWVPELINLTTKEIFAKYAHLKEIRKKSIEKIKSYIR
jgi:deoxyribodipyrimidine photo-lyase